MKNKEYLNNCELCGAQCCRNWFPAKYDENLVDKNGICKYLNQSTNLCTIYDNRPDFCKVYEWYDKKFLTEMSLDRYLFEQELMCIVLQRIAKRRQLK